MVYAIGAALSGFGNRFKMTDNLKATMAVIELNQMSVGVHGVELKAVDGSFVEPDTTIRQWTGKYIGINTHSPDQS